MDNETLGRIIVFGFLGILAVAVIVIVVAYIIGSIMEAKETKGMTKEEKDWYRQCQEEARQERKKKEICENCVHYNFWRGTCKIHYSHKLVDTLFDEAVEKKDYEKVSPGSSCNEFKRR